MNARRLALAALAALSLVSVPQRARAQLDVSVRLALPVAPPLVVIQPGVQVVEGSDEEVFVYGGGWWLRRGPVWYRAPRPGGPFAVVRGERVPSVLVRLPPPGHYSHYRAERREERREERHEVRHEEHHERQEARKERHEDEKALHKMHREHDEGEHKGRD